MNIVNVGYDSTNYYVLEQNRIRLLIDVGWPGTLPKLRGSLKRLGLTLKDLHYLLITHYHPDHAGLVQEVKDAGVKHVIFEQQVAAVALLKSYMKPNSGYVEIRIHDSIRLTTMASRGWLASLDFAGEVVSTPGHSADSISLVLDEGLAFTGDLHPPDMGGPELAESWARLRSLQVRTVYPGHGPLRSINP